MAVGLMSVDKMTADKIMGCILEGKVKKLKSKKPVVCTVKALQL
jgi:hypothetical protein